MIFEPFGKQKEFLKSSARIRAALAGKRGGKTEVGAIETIINLEKRPGFINNPIDPFVVVVIAPTSDMLRRLSMRKLIAYAKPFPHTVNETRQEISWWNGSVVYGISADKPQRLEGIKANAIWLDEAFQMNEQVFLESLARIADTKGRVWVTGSLGVQYKNPKAHWIYKHFKEKPLSDSQCFEWATADNPHIPREELERLQHTLDPVTYRQLFELSWDVQGNNLVYDNFSTENLKRHVYDPRLETYVSIDWGFTHPFVALYFQYDRQADTVYLFDEIHQSKLTLEQSWALMSQKPYRINEYFCDIAGLQTREQTAISNVQWFRQPPRNIHFKYRTSEVTHGIALMRSYICNMKGQRRLYIDERMCPKTVDEIRNYSYKEKSGILSEKPVDIGEDALSAARYFFVNKLDFTRPTDQMAEMNRWKLTGR